MKYGVILCDPPWSYSNRGTNGAAEKHYSTMTYRQLSLLPIGNWTEDNCVLFLWITNPQMAQGIKLIEDWGFEFVTGFPWIKFTGNPKMDGQGKITGGQPSWGTGFWVRGCSEYIAIARKGHVSPPQTQYLGILSNRLKHSKKPSCVHEIAESLPGPYLELFARERREGWHVWGDEVKSDINLFEGLPENYLQEKTIQDVSRRIKSAWNAYEFSRWTIGDAIDELIKAGIKKEEAYEIARRNMDKIKTRKWPLYLYMTAKTFYGHERRQHRWAWYYEQTRKIMKKRQQIKHQKRRLIERELANYPVFREELRRLEQDGRD